MSINGLICPHCQGKRNSIMCLASNPPQFEYQCCHCLWGIRFYEREDSYKHFNQEELDILYKNGIGKVY